jgi:CRISPR-associated protein Cas5d
MLLDIDFAQDRTPRFFRAIMRHGVVEVPLLGSVGVVS